MLDTLLDAEIQALTSPQQALAESVAQDQEVFLRAVVVRLAYARGLATQIQMAALQSAVKTVLDNNEHSIERCVERAAKTESNLRRWSVENDALQIALEQAKRALAASSTSDTEGWQRLLRLYARRTAVEQAMLDAYEEIARLRRQVWKMQKESVLMLESVVDKLASAGLQPSLGVVTEPAVQTERSVEAPLRDPEETWRGVTPSTLAVEPPAQDPDEAWPAVVPSEVTDESVVQDASNETATEVGATWSAQRSEDDATIRHLPVLVTCEAELAA